MSHRINVNDRVDLFGTDPVLSGEVVSVSDALVIPDQVNSFEVTVAWDEDPSRPVVVPGYALYPRP